MTTDPQTELSEPDNPAAWALARHIADHPVSTIQAAFRYLNAPVTVELHDPVSSAVAQSAPADRAAVLAEAAEALGRMDYEADSQDYGYDTFRDAWNGGVMDAAAELRSLVVEERAEREAQAHLDQLAVSAVCICGHTEQQHFEDACITEVTGCDCGDYLTPEAAREVIGRLQQEVKRLGLMVDEYGHGASALTYKLKRVRDLHRETCILAQGAVRPTAFTCGMCEVLDAPAAAPAVSSVGQAAHTTRSAVLSAAERTMLAYALDEAQEHIWSRDGFTEEDEAAVTSLRRLLVAQPAVVPAGAGEEPAHETREAEDPARIDRLRPEFFEHASVEAIDSQIRRAKTQQRSWGDRAQTMAILRQARVKQKELGDWPAGGAQQSKEAERIVAFRSREGRLLRCLAHTPGAVAVADGEFDAVTSDDLPDGGVCTFLVSLDERCGVDVLIPQQPKEA